MTEQQWISLYPFFTPDECGGVGMSWPFMRKVFRLRQILDVPIHINAGLAVGGHSPNSYHYRGEALDIRIEGVSPREIMAAIDDCGFGGVGYYPWWHTPGFHIDDRPHHRYQRWVSPEQGKYIYLLRDN